MANLTWLIVISLFYLGNALPASKMMNTIPMLGTGDGAGNQANNMNRFAILAEYALSGKHNVRSVFCI